MTTKLVLRKLLALSLLANLGTACGSAISNGSDLSTKSSDRDPAAGSKCLAAGRALGLHPSSIVFVVENAIDPRNLNSPPGLECSVIIETGEIVAVFVPSDGPPFVVTT